MVCVDTDILIDFLRNKEEAVSLMEGIANEGRMTTTVINGFELWKGAYRKNKDWKEISKLFDSIHLLNMDKESSKKAAEIFESLKKKGEAVDALDVMIASIAMINNEPLLTLNKKHFERIDGLRLV